MVFSMLFQPAKGALIKTPPSQVSIIHHFLENSPPHGSDHSVMTFRSDPSFFVFILATKTLKAQAVQVLQEMSVFFSERTAVLGLLMHTGNCKHSPLDYSLGYCYVPVTIASGRKA